MKHSINIFRMSSAEVLVWEIVLNTDIKSVILNYSTYKENAYEITEEVIDRNWKEIINKGLKTHRAIMLNEKEDENQTIYCRKLSVELIN